MALTYEPRSASERDAIPARFALAVADAGWFTTENLFRELEGWDVTTLLLRCMDFRNGFTKGLAPWPLGRNPERHAIRRWEQDLVLPSGWMKRFPRIGMRPIARAVHLWQENHAPGAPLALVMTYPYYLHLRDLLRPERCVYYNLDDYALYWPRHARVVGQLERRAVAEADVTVCVSKRRADTLRNEMPDAADRIYHLPHGTPSWALVERPWKRPAPPPADIAHLPRPLIGYVGSLEDRVDWPLLSSVSESFPDGSIVVVGRSGQGPDVGWYRDCQRFLARPNVHPIGWKSQGVIPHYLRSFDVCLIPYRTDHPFNLACCPTKIMDYMGSSRPVVSTDIPECRLHSDVFHVTNGGESFVASVRSVVEAGSDDGLAEVRLSRARANACRAVAGRLLELLGV